MSYESKHKLRKKIIQLCRAHDEKVKVDTKDFDLGVMIKRSTYLDSLALATGLVKAISKIKGMKQSEFDSQDEHSLQFANKDVHVSISIMHDGVFLFMGSSE